MNQVEFSIPAIRGTLGSHAFYATPHVFHDITTERGRPFAYYAYGTSLTQVTLDELAVNLDTPEAISVRREHNEHLIASFRDTPDLQDVLRVQLEPDGYNAYTNIDLALLLTTTVSDIENRKKRIQNRLMKRCQQQRATTR